MLVADERGYTIAARQKGKFGIEDIKGFGSKFASHLLSLEQRRR